MSTWLVVATLVLLTAGAPLEPSPELLLPSPEPSQELLPDASLEPLFESPMPSPDAPSETTSPFVLSVKPPPQVNSITPSVVNEGCVAVEHLTGYKLQHASHLRRNVLCARGFCATPNHAIIVDGEWTSMKRLCAARWDCVRSVKLVNNLALFANRRALVNGFITVTPYDDRFPRAAVWVAQAMEYVWNSISASSLLVLAGTVVVFLLSRRMSKL